METYFLSDLLAEMAKKINSKKEAILKKTIKDLSGTDIDFDFDQESKRRFKRIIMVVEGNKETYYLNNGTDDGVRIVTFELIDSPPVFGGEMWLHTSLTFKYY